MTKRQWSKFFWSDWEADEGLRQCSLAAQGLWMRMLCICAKGDPEGHLSIAGEPLDVAGVSRAVGHSETEVGALLQQLARWGVFSRNREGVIYSRRMVADIKKATIVTKNLPPGTPRKQKKNGALAPRPLASSSSTYRGSREERFQCFWAKYPHKVGKGAARRAFAKVNVSLDSLLRALDEYIRSKPKDRPWCNPATWLNQERWEDQPADGAQEDDTVRFRRMLEHEHKTGHWPFKTSKTEIPAHIRAEFETQETLQWAS